jgi:hypothetical protein
MDTNMMIQLAEEKISALQSEILKWETFIKELQVKNVMVVSSPIIDHSASIKETGYADIIRTHLIENEKVTAKSIALHVINKKGVPKPLHNKAKAKVYSQLATFERQGKVKKIRRQGNLFYKWDSSSTSKD